jgi:hypothetical protein
MSGAFDFEFYITIRIHNASIGLSIFGFKICHSFDLSMPHKAIMEGLIENSQKNSENV